MPSTSGNSKNKCLTIYRCVLYKFNRISKILLLELLKMNWFIEFNLWQKFTIKNANKSNNLSTKIRNFPFSMLSKLWIDNNPIKLPMMTGSIMQKAINYKQQTKEYSFSLIKCPKMVSSDSVIFWNSSNYRGVKRNTINARKGNLCFMSSGGNKWLISSRILLKKWWNFWKKKRLWKKICRKEEINWTKYWKSTPIDNNLSTFWETNFQILSEIIMSMTNLIFFHDFKQNIKV